MLVDTVSCLHFGLCGGCSNLDIVDGKPLPPPYETELAEKEARVRNFLAPFDVREWRPILGSPETWRYRNKMEFAFAAPLSPPEGLGLALGLRQARSFSRVVDLAACSLISQECEEILLRVRDWAKAAGLTGYHRKAHVGDLRYLVVREGQNTGQRMVVLIASKNVVAPAGCKPGPITSVDGMDGSRPTECRDDVFKSLQSSIASLTTTAWLGVTDSKSDVARAQDMRLLWGSGAIEERLGAITYRISPYSFFQTNTRGTERLYALLADWGRGIGGALVDAYCGSGGISLALAGSFDRVVGVDSNAEAIEDARFNAEQNGVGNAEFVAEDALDFLKKLPASKLAVQLSAAIVDPPRPGLHPKALQALLELNPPRLAYVSCNPESLARDLQALAPYYKIIRAQPVDLFPHTTHVETVAFLEHR